MNSNSNQASGQADHVMGEPTKIEKHNKKWFIAGIVLLFAILSYLSRSYLNLDYLAQQETQLKEFFQSNPLLVYAVAFLIYVAVTGLSIPGATALSLLYAWFFDFASGLILISFASTAGATIAFLISRYLFRDWFQKRFHDRVVTINEAMDREGNLYLFMMRLIPIFPFFVVNAAMGLTKIRIFTFWWVSQIGMLAGTILYVYAGSRIPDLATLQEEGIKSVFSGSQLLQLTLAFAMLGTFPIAAKKIISFLRQRSLQENIESH
ncbi:TVP38/TMEM64 family protein [Mariniblastus sp.]|nr:TVP38/TMEM64 family protein [Mariniblastus sp.]MDA7904142.1 TVP38/TMEM64 family protein [bacterium]MDA7903436.1 TVP38/TMEM64 family protein [Mariniblastus sp.]MDA7924141.1 TVP38/TMEM64 family protein [Mariniblastus sp.]MDA7928578.1 TVP38/TMEM64 family protein [Mariniblastus sp.]